MNQLTKAEYEQQVADCEGVCVITDKILEATNQMKCVRCPFCLETVDAILTKTQITCPACKVSVKL